MTNYKYLKTEHKRTIKKLLYKPERLNSFEKDLLNSLKKRVTYTDKQFKCLKKICKKYKIDLAPEYSNEENNAVKSMRKSSYKRKNYRKEI